MQRVLPSQQALPLYAIATTRAIEARAQAALGPNVLMQRAGLALARLALALAPHARGIWVAAGPGNNGGDGLEAAMHLHGWGKQVAVSLLANEASQPEDARAALQRARAAGVPIEGGLDIGLTPDLAIDALLGVGASRAAEGAIEAAIRRLNALSCPVLAADVPSGLNADTGAALGAHAVRASHTLSLLTLKPGLFTGVGRDHCADIWFDDLGVDASDAAPGAWLSGAAQLVELLPTRRHAQHKGSFGDVAVVGGAPGMSGAALLAARAALAAGAGRVYLDLLGSQVGHGLACDPQRPELMLRSGWARGDTQLLRDSLVVCGCGGGDAVREVLPRLLSHAARALLDADALNAIAADSSLQAQLTARAGRGHATVLTPHPLEAARLLACSAAQVQADRLQATTHLAAKFNCVIVLKGSGSVIATPGRAPQINSTGNAALASAGTGDVLAGWLGGLWSQLAASRPSGGAAEDTASEAAFDAARSAVFLHGLAAQDVRSGPLRAGDLIERMHELRRAHCAPP
jgi:ADP-dependent NAD(P)H-hydrate dehydratase / NAD(P)H-hydrate epimerase